MSRPGLFLLMIAAVFVVTPSGCHRNALPLARVRGTVTLDGKPLTQGSVHFMPDNAKGTRGPMALGGIGADGKFVLTTFKTGDGAQVGFHRILVNCWKAVSLDPGNRQGPPLAKSLIPEHYNDEITSGLLAEVKAGIQNEFTFDLKSAALGNAPQHR